MPRENQNPRLAEELEEELPGIFNWALEGLRRLRFQGQFTEPAAAQRAQNEFREERDSARSFLKEHYVAGTPADELVTQDIYTDYLDWSIKNGVEVIKQSAFGKAMKAVFPTATPAKLRVEGDGWHRRRGYKGIKRAELAGVAGSD